MLTLGTVLKQGSRRPSEREIGNSICRHFSEILPWFAAVDHVNYTRWGKQLPCTDPELHQGFQHGDFVTKETKNAFDLIADSQALKHVNKSGKVAGGLVRITRMRTESARDRWYLTYNERAKLSEETKEMFATGTAEDGVGHKDLGKARVRRDEDDVQRLNKCHISEGMMNLVVVTTRDVASEEIKQDLLEVKEIGKTIVIEFVQVRLIKKEVKFPDSSKQQKLKTFETLYSVPVSLDKDKTVANKADRDLLR